MGSELYLSNQIDSLSKSIGATDGPTQMTRYMGGNNRENQPYINGYHQILVQLPEKLFTTTNITDSTKWLTSTCEGFTPHSITTNFVDIMGAGQVGSSFPSSRTVNREFTLTFREYRLLPILNIFRTWHALFDPHLGISTLSANDFIPLNYKGSIIVAIMKPTASGSGGTLTEDDIEECYMYEGVFPSICPDDTIATIDQATQDSIQASITFKFDGSPLDKAYPNLVKHFLSLTSENKYSNTYQKIGTNLT